MISLRHRILAAMLTATMVAVSITFLMHPHHQAQAQAGGAGCLIASAAAAGAAIATVETTLGLAVPVNDKANLTANTITAKSTAATESKECLLDAIAWALAKAAIQSISQSIINWINNGFEGSPVFVTDLRGFLGFVELDALENFLGSNVINAICSPWQFDIRLALELQLGGGDRSLSCTLGDVVDNVEDFVEGDFTQGGLDGWLVLSTRNNPHIDYLQGEAQARANLAIKKEIESTKLEFGRGFLSLESCTSRPANPSDPNTQPGDTVEDCIIGTPGAVVEQQLEHALGTNLRQLELADEIDEILTAFISQLINQVITKGLGSL